MKKTFFLLALIFASFLQIANAGVVPGTIQKSGYTSSNTCSTSITPYAPAGGYCYTGGCKTGDYNGACNNAYLTPNTCTCDNSSPEVACTPQYVLGIYVGCTGGSSAVSNTCTCNNSVPVPDTMSCYRCTSYYDLPTTSGTLTFTNYLYNNNSPTYASDGSSRHLSNDNPESCNRWANGTNHIPPIRNVPVDCGDGNSSYYSGGDHGVCNSFGSTDNLITSYNQIGSVARSSPSNGDATCTVEGRYAMADDTGPTTSVNGVSTVFDGDVDHWCNMTKYTASNYGTTANPTLAGCTYYKDQPTGITHSAGVHPDLLENLEIPVSDTSGISEIRVELGSCDATYSLPTGISTILQSSTSGIKPAYTSFTLKYNMPISVDGTSLPGLVQKFGKTRLDECLTEGKNFLRVTTKDSARLNADGVTYAANTAVFDYSGQNKFIKVDNSASRIKLTGEASEIAESNASAGCFIGSVTVDNKWKNYTISGNIQSGDPFGANTNTACATCTSLTYTGVTCTTSAIKGNIPTLPNNTNHLIWTAPGGINPITGTFTGSICDGLGPTPSATSCDWNCATGFSYNATTQTCVQSSNLFILFASGSANVSGPYAAKLTNDPNTSHGLLKSKIINCTPLPQYAVSSVKYPTFSFSINNTIAHFTGNTPTDTRVFPIAENSSTGLACATTCNPGYSLTGGVCTPDYRARWCHVGSATGTPVLGYDPLDPGGAISTAICIEGGVGTFPAGTIIQRGSHYIRCDAYSKQSGVDTSVPLANSYCPTPVVVPPVTPICTAGGTVPCVVVNGSTAPIANRYPGCDTDDITVGTQTWAACNVGASVAGTTSTSYGGYYQWGRNVTTFTTTNISPYDWQSPQNDNAWGGAGTTPTIGTFTSQGSPATMIGPCATGYHVPTALEWNTVYTTLGSDYTIVSTLKLSKAGARLYYSDGSLIFQNSVGLYWSSSPNSITSYFLLFDPEDVNPVGNDVRADGFSVRCLKN